MNTRDMTYGDYGMDKEDLRKVLDMCQESDITGVQELIYQSAVAANPQIHEALYMSLAFDMSYERVNGIRYVPISKNSFYAYRRRAIANLYDLMRLYGLTV